MSFDEVKVSVTNLMGADGTAFVILMTELPQEPLTIAFQSMGSAQSDFDLTVDRVLNRKAFGQPISEFQNTRDRLADLNADLLVGWAYVDQCLQLHGGHGFMRELISRNL